MYNKKITPFLWIDGEIDKVIDYYKSIFMDFKLITDPVYIDSPGGITSVCSIKIFDQEINLMCTKSPFYFNESVSFVIECVDQKEVDYYWEKITKDGGKESACGWCKDKYGLSWQVTPLTLKELLNSVESEKRTFALNQMLKMGKIEISKLTKN